MLYIPKYCDNDSLFEPEYLLLIKNSKDGNLEYKSINRKYIGRC